MTGRLAVIVVGLGLVVAAVTGRAELLVRPWFVPVVLAAGAAIAVAALRHRVALSSGRAALLLAPVAIGISLTPSVVDEVKTGSADLASVTQRIGDPSNPLLAGRGGSVTVLQILTAEQKIGAVALAGQHVTVVAKATGAHTLSRSVIVCCAADAQAVAVTTTGTSLPGHSAWVRVGGHLATRGSHTVLVATTVQRVTTPANPFL